MDIRGALPEALPSVNGNCNTAGGASSRGMPCEASLYQGTILQMLRQADF